MKKIIIIVFFVPMACCVLGTTSVGDHANIFEDGEEYWNQGSSLVAIAFLWLFANSSRIRDMFVDAPTSNFLGGGQEMGHPAPREFFQSQRSLKNFLNCRHACQDMLCKYSGTAKRII
jgi:hypothetical protein